METETQKLLELWLEDDQTAFITALRLAEQSAPQAYTEFIQIAGENPAEEDPEMRRITVRMSLIGHEATGVSEKIQRILQSRKNK